MENNEQSDNERNGTIRGYFAFKSKGEWQTNTVFIDHVFIPAWRTTNGSPPLPGTNTNLKTKEYGNEQTTKY